MSRFSSLISKRGANAQKWRIQLTSVSPHFFRQRNTQLNVTNESETLAPSFQQQSAVTQHQDTMSLQDVDLGLLQDDPADYEDQDKENPVPHIERTLTEESAGKL